MTNEDPPTVLIGKFFLAPGIGEGKVWIGKARGPDSGEGGDFSIEALEELIAKFYAENF